MTHGVSHGYLNENRNIANSKPVRISQLGTATKKRQKSIQKGTQMKAFKTTHSQNNDKEIVESISDFGMDETNENIPCYFSPRNLNTSNLHPSNSTQSSISQSSRVTEDLQTKCRKLGIHYEPGPTNEPNVSKNYRKKKYLNQIKKAQEKLNVKVDDIPPPPPLHENPHFNYAMDAIRSFELKEMAYKFNLCSICHERRLEMKMASKTCV